MKIVDELSNKNRNITIDIIKGLAIISVVLGHSLN